MTTIRGGHLKIVVVLTHSLQARVMGNVIYASAPTHPPPPKYWIRKPRGNYRAVSLDFILDKLGPPITKVSYWVLNKMSSSLEKATPWLVKKQYLPVSSASARELHVFLGGFFFWLCWVLAAACGLSLVAASGGHSLLQCASLPLWWLLLLWSTGSRRAGLTSCGMRASVVVARGLWTAGSVAMALRLSCSVTCGIFLDQRSNPCPLHWQVDSQPLSHQGGPELHILIHPKGLKKKLMALIDFNIIYFDVIWDLALFQRGLGEMNKTQVKLKEKAIKRQR